MKIEYNKESDVAFIWIDSDYIDAPNCDKKTNISKEIWPKETNENVAMLFDDDNMLIGFEILFASSFLSKKILQ